MSVRAPSTTARAAPYVARAARIVDRITDPRQWSWIWAVLPITVWAVARQQDRLDTFVAALLALGLFVLARRAPAKALVALIIFLPCQLFAFSHLYQWGVPKDVLRPLAAVKETLGLGIVAAGFLEFQRQRRRADMVDRLVLVYLAGVVVYLALPRLFTPFAPTDLQTRLLGFRVDAGWALLFLGARHAPIGAQGRKAATYTMIGVAALVAGIGLYQWASPAGWYDYVVTSARVPRYQIQVIGDTFSHVDFGLSHLRERPVRVGSIFLGTFEMADYLLIVAALSIESAVRRRVPWTVAVAGALCMLAIYASQGRADSLALVVVALVALRPGPGRVVANRFKLAFGLLVIAAILIPSVGTGRFAGNKSANESADAHQQEFESGVSALFDRPLGSGLGSSPAVGRRFGAEGTLFSDNTVLQVGNELGVLPMAVYIAIIVLMFRGLRFAAREEPDDHVGAALLLGAAGLFAAGMFHHAFADLTVSWTFWALAGLAIGTAEQHARARLDATAGAPSGLHVWRRAALAPVQDPASARS